MKILNFLKDLFRSPIKEETKVVEPITILPTVSVETIKDLPPPALVNVKTNKTQIKDTMEKSNKSVIYDKKSPTKSTKKRRYYSKAKPKSSPKKD